MPTAAVSSSIHSVACVSQVCQRWYQLCSSADLWRAHCRELGRWEGVGGDLVEAVEDGHRGGTEGEGGGAVVDWKRAFRDLSRLMTRIKKLVVRAGKK